MATITHSIGSGRDYATVAAWIAATTGLLGTDIYVGECYDDFDADVNITGGSTSATSYRVLSVPSASRHDGTAGSGVKLARTGSWGVNQRLIQINEAYSRVEWLEVTTAATNAPASGTNYGVYLGAANTRASHMIVHDMVRTTRPITGIGNLASVTGVLAYRNIVYDIGGGGTVGKGLDIQAAAGMTNYLIGNTAYGCGICGINAEAYGASASTMHVRNNVAISNTQDYVWFKGASGIFTSSHNASGDATADDQGGTGHLISQSLASMAFVSTTGGSEDFHIGSGSVLRDAGVTLAAPYDEDIDGVAVSGTWDIGADEYVAGTTDLTGTAAGTSSMSGSITTGTTEELTGTAAGTSAMTGDVDLDIYQTQTMAGTSSMSGTIDTPQELTGTAAGTSSMSGTPDVDQAVSGTAAGTSSMSGAVSTGMEENLTGAAAGTSSMSGTPSLDQALTGSMAGTSAMSGSVTTDNTQELTGTAAGGSAMSGGVEIDVALSGTAVGTSSMVAIASYDALITGTAAGSSAMTGTVTFVEIVPLTEITRALLFTREITRTLRF